MQSNLISAMWNYHALSSAQSIHKNYHQLFDGTLDGRS